MKKMLLSIVLAMACAAPAVYAQHRPPPPGHHPHHPAPPPPPHHHDSCGDSGLANAAAITSIVASGVSILSDVSKSQQQPTTVVQPVVVQPAAQPAAQPVAQPAVQPVVYPQ